MWPMMRACAAASAVASAVRARACGECFGLGSARALQRVLLLVLSPRALVLLPLLSARRQFRGMSARDEDKPMGGGERARFKKLLYS